MGLRAFLCRLFGCAEEPPRRVDLTAATNTEMNAVEGSVIPDGIAVRARYYDDGSPASGVDVVVSVVVGPGTLRGGASEGRLVTGQDGTASVDVSLPTAGYTLYQAALADDPNVAVFFVSRTNAMTAQLFLFTQPCQPAAAGQIVVEISAIDYGGNPVSGANLVIEAHSKEIFEDSSIDGQVTETAPGRYQGVITNDRAGAIMLICQDLDSKNQGQTPVHILPGAADHFQVIGDLDPRFERPYNRIDLQVQLQDERGNPLSPTGIQATTEDGNTLPTVIDGPNALFPVEAVGYQFVPIRLSDTGSEIRDTVSVEFAATWLGRPGVVYTDTEFTTALYVTPRPGTATDHGTVTIQFDPELSEFRGFEPSGKFELRFESRVEGNQLILDFQSEKSYAADDYIEGMYLGEISWGCLGEGETCFLLSGQMSPTTNPWDLCLQQKKDRQDCICVNVISIAGNAASLAAGDAIANGIAGVISSPLNVGECCPVLTVQKSNETITQAQLNAIVGADGTVSTRAEQRALHADQTKVKANCINIKAVPVAIPVARGTVRGNTDRGRGSILMNPATVAANANNGIHEVGHALGLNHRNVRVALMRPRTPVGNRLNDAECETVFRNIGRFPC